MSKKIIISIAIIFLSGTILIASQSSNFELVEFAFVAGGEKADSSNFVLTHSILGEIIGESSSIYALDPSPPRGTGATITAYGTIDDNGATLNLEVDEPEAEYQAAITEGSWEAEGVELKEGLRKIIVTGTDILGNPERKEIEVTVDTVPPHKPILKKVITPTSSSPQTISGHKETNSSIWISSRELVKEVVKVNPQTMWSYDLPLQEGDNSFSIFSKDMANNASPEVSEYIYLDTNAPWVEISLPIDGGSITNDPDIETPGIQVEVEGTCDYDTTSVEVNGIPTHLTPKDEELQEFSITITLVDEENTWQTIFATGRDLVGNYYTDRISVFIDLQPPHKPELTDSEIFRIPVNTSPQRISGIKDANTSLWLNGVQIIPLGPETAWSYDMPLNPGVNPVSLYVETAYGQRSPEPDPDEIESIIYDPDPPKVWNVEVNDRKAYLLASNVLEAEWNGYDTDPTSTGIAEYQYAIGTEEGSTDVLDWTSSGIEKGVSINDLGLIHKQIYYFTVKARDSAGNWSEPVSSNGITVNKSIPEIERITPLGGSKFKDGERVQICVSCDDADGDILKYEYFINGAKLQEGDEILTYEWQIREGDFGRKNIEIYVDDGLGGKDSGLVTIFVHFKPVNPPER